MGRYRVTADHSASVRAAISVLAVIALVAMSAQGQFQTSAGSAALHGTVRDSSNHPVAAATVCLQAKDPSQTLTATTDLEGSYRFPALREGTYTLRAEMAGYNETSSGPLVLKPKDVKTIDLKLERSAPSGPQGSSAAVPEFYDEPQFTVAGVSDTTNLGGHGSDVVVRTTETLAKDTASLSGESPASRSASSGTAAEKSLRDEVEHNTGSFDANYHLGKLLVDGGKAREALPYLERASRLRPDDYENAYELALARENVGAYERAHSDAQALLARHDTAELHHLLADIEEKQGSPVEAVREYQRAAEMNPSEPNLFDWGAELLLHSAVEPALEVFGKGNRLFPHSERMLVGLGVAWYGRGSYDQAVKRLCEASDLNPDDPVPYQFLGRLQSVDTTPSDDSVVEKLARFARLQPENATANYYYALSLWNRRQGPNDTKLFAQVESLLEKAVRRDPKLGVAFLQLGILHSEQRDLPKAVSAYQKAVEASPRLAQAHYRLAQAYRQTGDTSRAKTELEIYEQISRESAEQVVRERHEIQQFVYTLRDGTAASQPQ
jgi:tetratricopeptide (TPR) repeat protein